MYIRTTLALAALTLAAPGLEASAPGSSDVLEDPRAPADAAARDDGSAFEDLRFAASPEPGAEGIPARVYAPRGRRAAGAAPSVVFMHGRAQLGRDYAGLAEHFSARGYYVFLIDSARWNVVKIGDDARTLYGALARENARVGSRFFGALAMDRVALVGHSWGGANVYRVLADNPGYRLGVCFAPHVIAASYCQRAQAPILTIVGEGDRITPPALHARPNYDAHELAGAALKLLHVLGESANHANVVRGRYNGASAADRALFEHCAGLASAFCDHWLQGDTRALGRVVDPALATHAWHEDMRMRVATPQLFESGRAALGETARVHVLSDAGLAFHAYAFGRGARATSFGVLALDPATSAVPRFTLLSRPGVAAHEVPIPDDEALLGLRLAFQGFAATAHGARLTPQCLEWTLDRARAAAPSR